ncbi:WG repeat-containing protein [uncultured Bacteroides sp.]|uniref:WG repeat-containing protein n=1 Tax=uncultured Bacteroides sp. TaxID=162156 RepID=UPI0025DA9BB5|nr:WG repeat-containing protein [uncultured Bacteroides sp.]
MIAAKYKAAHAFSEGLASVSEDGKKFGYINPKGEVVIPFIYDHITPFINGTASVGISDEVDGKLVEQYFVINKKGERISEIFEVGERIKTSC